MSTKNIYGPHLIESRKFSVEDPESLARELNTAYEETAVAVNQKVSGIFSKEEIATGEQVFVDLTVSPEKIPPVRYVSRKAFEIDGIASGTNNIPHGLAWSDSFFVVKLYGALVNRSAEESRPLPNVSDTPGDEIGLRVSGDNIQIITTSSNFANYQGFVVIEYIP